MALWSGSRGQHFANPADGFTLFCADGKKFETVTQAITITHQRAQLDWICCHGQGKLHRNNFADLEFAGQCRADAVFSNFA